MKILDSQVLAPTLLMELENELVQRTGRSQFAIEARDRVQLWAGESPYLIELLSQSLAERLRLASVKRDVQLIDDLVQQTIIEDWRENTAAAHFCEVESTLLSYSRIDSLLILYLKVLQRGETAAENGAEQAVLLASGLVIQDGSMLRIANAIYRSVFDLDWLEQQVPGLTKPVSIVRSGVLPFEGSHQSGAVSVLAPIEDIFADEGLTDQSVSEAKRPFQAMVLVGGMAALVWGLTIYVQASNLRSLTANDSSTAVDLVVAVPTTDRQRFDSGTEHAINGRWLMMMREYCSISERSAYFVPAERHMKQWVTLYEEDIEAAQLAFVDEGNLSCEVMPQ